MPDDPSETSPVLTVPALPPGGCTAAGPGFGVNSGGHPVMGRSASNPLFRKRPLLEEIWYVPSQCPKPSPCPIRLPQSPCATGCLETTVHLGHTLLWSILFTAFPPPHSGYSLSPHANNSPAALKCEPLDGATGRDRGCHATLLPMIHVPLRPPLPDFQVPPNHLALDFSLLMVCCVVFN